jgi:hypothetical protein
MMAGADPTKVLGELTTLKHLVMSMAVQGEGFHVAVQDPEAKELLIYTPEDDATELPAQVRGGCHVADLRAGVAPGHQGEKTWWWPPAAAASCQRVCVLATRDGFSVV